MLFLKEILVLVPVLWSRVASRGSLKRRVPQISAAPSASIPTVAPSPPGAVAVVREPAEAGLRLIGTVRRPGEYHTNSPWAPGAQPVLGALRVLSPQELDLLVLKRV